MLTYDKFIDEVQRLITEELGDETQLQLVQIPKNNGLVLEGLRITFNEVSVSPICYLEGYFEQLQEGQLNLPEIVADIISCCRENQLPEGFQIGQILDFHQVVNNLRFKVVNLEQNRKMLETVPHVPILDLAVVFYLLLKADAQGQMTAMIQQEHLKHWRISLEELKTAAFKTSLMNQPAIIKSMNQVMHELCVNNLGDEFSDEVFDTLFSQMEADRELYVLSNESGIFGAGCILYLDVLKDFSETVGADLIILPSSVHETLIMSDNHQVSYKELEDMVAHINATEVSEEDRLSNRIYRYDRATDELVIVLEDMKK